MSDSLVTYNLSGRVCRRSIWQIRSWHNNGKAKGLWRWGKRWHTIQELEFLWSNYLTWISELASSYPISVSRGSHPSFGDFLDRQFRRAVF